MDFSGLPAEAPHILDYHAKWDASSPQYRGTQAVLADVSDELKSRLQKVALDAYRALRVRDYGRIDLRVTPGEEIFVIEVNASCYLEQTGEFASAAAAAGLDYETLINRIATCALERRARPEKPMRGRRRIKVKKTGFIASAVTSVVRPRTAAVS
jgi:D-alanine-D-alanine ligase